MTDSFAIAEIIRELGWFPYITEETTAETETRVARHLELCLADDSHTVLVAENSAKEVVGYVVVHWMPYLMLAGPEGYISELFIRESERRKGIGSRLLDSVKSIARTRGGSRLQLVTGRNREAYDFYRQLGWKERPGIADFVFPLN